MRVPARALRDGARTPARVVAPPRAGETVARSFASRFRRRDREVSRAPGAFVGPARPPARKMASTEGSGDERTPIMLPARRVPARTRGWARSAQRGGTQTGAISLLAAICAMVAMFVVVRVRAVPRNPTPSRRPASPLATRTPRSRVAPRYSDPSHRISPRASPSNARPSSRPPGYTPRPPTDSTRCRP